MLSLFTTAAAFCGFYVGGADAQLYNDATLVAMMRDKNTTVLAMQNTYQGPPEDFALVVPVPQVLQKDNVRTLPGQVFKTLDRLSAPRLVEYWEQDPCQPMYDEEESVSADGMRPQSMPRPAPRKAGRGVTIEAQFQVAEYDILILSAKDSDGLEIWLQEEKYNIPTGASSALRPYVATGTKFFVAKVDPKRVKFDQDRAVLSPLRMHFESDDFALPIRLGLLNSKGEQDLLVHILGKSTRYEVANYDNITVPTNLQVSEDVKGNFPAFYDALFRNTVADNPNAVVTEYSWRSSSCDPCPGPTLSSTDIATLGGDVLNDSNPRNWTLTRLHYRYGADAVDEDLVFKKADGLIGGRGTPDAKGNFREAVQKSSSNQFQGRYAILHYWAGPVACSSPQRGLWGGPPGQGNPTPTGIGDSMARRTAVEVDLEEMVRGEWGGVKKAKPKPSPKPGGSMIPEVK